ncbi:MAG: hypothetical protein ACREOV_02730 [Candidatus Dormibacteraceae bacterium]
MKRRTSTRDEARAGWVPRVHDFRRTARRLLDDERERISTAKSAVEGDLADEHEGARGELSTYDQHPADTGTEVADEERGFGLREDLQLRLEENGAVIGALSEASRTGLHLCHLTDYRRYRGLPPLRPPPRRACLHRRPTRWVDA